MKYVIPPLDRILHIVFPTKEEKLLREARLLEIALEQGDTRKAMVHFNHMMRFYHEIRRQSQ